jgi:hypothetical protein
MTSMRARWRRRKEHRALVRAARPLLPPRYATVPSLPVRTVRPGCTEWAIHGIAHGQRRVMRLAPDVLDTIRAEVAGWAGAGETVLLEPGFATTLGLDGALELEVPNLLGLLPPRQLFGFVVRFLLLLPLLPFALVLTRFSRDPEWPYLRAALRDPRAMVPLAEAHELLQPTNAMEEAAPSAGERFRLAYSTAMAHAAVRRAPAAGGRVHVLVGLGHVRDLVRLLGEENALPPRAAPS